MRLRHLSVLTLALAVVACGLARPPGASASAIDGRGMWIWYVDRSDGGSVSAIIARSRAAGIQTLYVKAADGGSYWSQFNASLVRELHAGGLRVCAWQYVYGNAPVTEAIMGARAVARGADCLVIDAEAEYEGKYASAQTYMRALRARIGYRYPVGLASFPYVDYHPGFPYSVFLAPGGAQYNMPQMYWRDIGSSISTVFRHTWAGNRIYGRWIYPLGQTYNMDSSAEARWFRGMTVHYGARGISWWDYAWTSANGLWSAISGFFSSVSSLQYPSYPHLGEGERGDEVVLLQERLERAVGGQPVTGLFGPTTKRNLERFQARHRLSVTGVTSTNTWRVLLRYHPVVPSWVGGAAPDTGGARLGATSSGSGGASVRAPRSATTPAVADEIELEPQRTEAAHP